MAVSLALNPANLELRIVRVHHNLSLMSCVHHETNDPICVSEGAASQKQVLAAYTDILRSLMKGAFEFVNLIVRFLAYQ